ECAGFWVVAQFAEMPMWPAASAVHRAKRGGLFVTAGKLSYYGSGVRSSYWRAFAFAFFLADGLAVFPVADCCSSVKESAALNGYCRTDFCPVVLSVMSTRRLLASNTVCRLSSTLRRCSGVSSGFCST